MINDEGYLKNCIWQHSKSVHELYRKRCCQEVPEMEASAQAAELLAPLVRQQEVVLDAGCGSGYFYHSLKKRVPHSEYYGIDASPALIKIGHTTLPNFGLSVDRLKVIRIEDLDGEVDHVVCVNVLSNIDNYHKPLERLLRMTRRSIVLRESVHPSLSRYTYVKDMYLDEGIDLRVYVNTYPEQDFVDFIQSYGFNVRAVEDNRTKGQVEMVIDHPHYWKFFVAERL